MATYLERARKWVEDAPDLSAEQLESAIEAMGFRLKDAQGLTEGQVQDIRDTLSYLNGQLKEMVGTDDSEVGLSSADLPQATPVDASLPVDNQKTVDLDLTPLVPEVDGETVVLSTTEKAQAVDELLASGLIQKGVSSNRQLQNS